MKPFCLLLCRLIGHDPSYLQARVMIQGKIASKKYSRCARCGCDDSLQVHTPGILDVHAWLILGTRTCRFSLIEWHRGKRCALNHRFWKRPG